MTDNASRAHPQLQTGLYILKINGKDVRRPLPPPSPPPLVFAGPGVAAEPGRGQIARMASPEAQQELMRRPLTVSFTDNPEQIDHAVQVAAEERAPAVTEII